MGEIIDMTYVSELNNGIAAVRELIDAVDYSSPLVESQLMMDDPKAYCRLVLKRIAYTYAIAFKQELLRVNAEFMQDENGKIWLVFARDIVVTPLNVKNVDIQYLINSEAFVKTKQDTVDTNEEMDDIERPGHVSKNAKRIAGDLGDYYESMKLRVGVDMFLHAEKPFTKSNKAFAKLRPTAPYTFE
jgi:hypothetical protein